MRNAYAAGLIVLAITAVAAPAHAQIDDDGRYTIMRPEPGVPPKYKTPRGSTEHVVIPPSTQVPPPQAAVPPPLVVPQTGQGGAEPAGAGAVWPEPDRDLSGSRRALRAPRPAPTAGDRAAFVGTCINQ